MQMLKKIIYKPAATTLFLVILFLLWIMDAPIPAHAASNPLDVKMSISKADDDKVSVKASWQGNAPAYAVTIKYNDGCGTSGYVKSNEFGHETSCTIEQEEGIPVTYTVKVYTYDNKGKKSTTCSTAKKTFRIRGKYTKKTADIIKSNIKKSDSRLKKIKFAHDWIVKNYKYDEDTGADGHFFASSMGSKKSVCQGYSKTFIVFMEEMGIPVRYVSSDSHSWNMVKLSGKWYHVDCTWDDPDGAEKITKKYPVYSYFLQSTKNLAKKDTKDHSFKKSKYPKCTSTTYDNGGDIAGYEEKTPDRKYTYNAAFHIWKNGKMIDV